MKKILIASALACTLNAAEAGVAMNCNLQLWLGGQSINSKATIVPAMGTATFQNGWSVENAQIQNPQLIGVTLISPDKRITNTVYADANSGQIGYGYGNNSGHYISLFCSVLK